MARATGGHHPTPTATPKPTPTPTPKPAATPKPTGTPIVPPTPTPLPTGVQPIFGCLHCPLKVTFREPEDFLGLQGEIGLPPSFDPSGSNLLIEVFNAGGTVYAGELFPGDLQRKGRKFQFKDRPAKTGLGSRDGIFKAQIKPGKSGLWRIKVKIFDDLSAATVPEMTVRITMSGMVFEKSATWQSNAKGYLLDRLPLS